MISFDKIRIRNFLSVGDDPIEISFRGSHITLVTGENGSAKSAICIDSIFYALYGKSFRKVNLPNIVNSITKKNMVIELTFSAWGRNYRVVRGQKPNIFEIYIDGTLKEQMANVKDYQEFLTENVLKMDEKTFRQLIIVGSGSYIPFMSLTTPERRVVIEDLLRIDIFSEMQKIAKGYLSEIESDISVLQSDMNVLSLKIEMHNKSNNDTIQDIENDISQKKADIIQYEQEKKECEAELSTELSRFSQKDHDELKDKLTKLQNNIIQAKQMRAKYIGSGAENERMLKFFQEHDSCPTCFQRLEKNFVEQKISELTKKITEYNSNLKSFDEKINELVRMGTEQSHIMSDIIEITKNVEAIKKKIETIDWKIRSISDEIEKLDEKKGKILAERTTDFSALKSEYQVKESELAKKEMREEAIHYIISMLKDNGVKSIIIGNILPVINKLISKYLDIIGFGIGLELDSEFNAKFSSPGREQFNYNNFSEGEKLRLDTAIMFSFRELAKIQSSISTNLLILDEFDRGTLDETGFQSIVDILMACTNENIIVISHSPDYFSSIADRVIWVEKKGSFSSISIKS